MSYYEDSFRHLLSGVSQQEPQDRLPGQVTQQTNMRSDLVRGLRRRPGVTLDFNWPGVPYGDPQGISGIGNANPADLVFYDTVMGDRRLLFTVNINTGVLHTVVVNGTSGAVLTEGLSGGYLGSTQRNSIKFAPIKGALFIANTNQIPIASSSVAQYPGAVNAGGGWFYISAGSYSTRYEIRMDYNLGWISAYYVTPDGTSAAHIAQTRPEYIAEQLVTALNAEAATAGLTGTFTREGAYVTATFSTHKPIKVSALSAHRSIVTSGDGHLADAAQLPAKLPPTGHNFVQATGSLTTPVYYRYDSDGDTWEETAAPGGRRVLTNMPGYAYITAPEWLPTPIEYGIREAGDDESNPNPAFTRYGISGMGAFQGRLVLLSREYICMSSSDTPVLFYRKTVNSILPGDAIEVASTTERQNPLIHASIYNSSLYLSSISHQEKIRGDSVITPDTAAPQVVAYYQAHASAAPVPIDQSLLLPYTRNPGLAGIRELYPSDAVDERLVGTDITAHIPTYIDDDISFITAASNAGLVLIGSLSNPKRVLVHEFMRIGSEKPHQAWHEWEFAHSVVYAYLDGSTIYLVFHNTELGASTYFIGAIDMQSGEAEDSAALYLDYSRVLSFVDASALTGSQPELQDLIDAVGADTLCLTMTPDSSDYVNWKDFSIVAVAESGEGAGTDVEVVHAVVNIEGTPTLAFGIPGALPGNYRVGIRFTSTVEPTPPILKDRNGVPIKTQRSYLHKYVLHLNNSGKLTVDASDFRVQLPAFESTPVLFSTPGFEPGQPLKADGTVYIPARLDAKTAAIKLSTDSIYDMNITSIEYGMRYTQRYGRR